MAGVDFKWRRFGDRTRRDGPGNCAGHRPANQDFVELLRSLVWSPLAARNFARPPISSLRWRTLAVVETEFARLVGPMWATTDLAGEGSREIVEFPND